MKAIKILVFLALLVGTGYWVAGPYIAVTQLQRAVAAKDEAALARHVDFAAVRESVKEQFSATVLERMGAEENSLFAALGTALAPTMIGPVVDAYLTPAGLVEIINGDLPGDGKSADTRDGSLLKDAKLGYESIDRFAVTTRDAERPVKFILERRGWEWRVTDVVLPLETMSIGF